MEAEKGMRFRKEGSVVHPYTPFHTKNFTLLYFSSVCDSDVVLFSLFVSIFLFLLQSFISMFLIFHFPICKLESSQARNEGEKMGQNSFTTYENSKKSQPPFSYSFSPPPPPSEYACVRRGMSGPLRLSPGS